MIRRLATMLMVSAAIFVVAGTALAQRSFYSTPKDTIIATVLLEAKQSLMFQQYPTTGQNLNLHWKQFSLSIPAQWEASLCDNGTCYTDLPVSGFMNTVWPGDYGLMKLDITPHVNYGTAVIRYTIWDSSTAGYVDTLTWVIHSVPTGIGNNEVNQTFAFTSGKTLFISNIPGSGKAALLFDVAGKKVFQKNLQKQEEVMDLSFLNEGLYVLHITGLHQPYAQKIFVGSVR